MAMLFTEGFNMVFALVKDNSISAIGRIPDSARRLDNGRWVLGLRDAAEEFQKSCGWFVITETQRPEDTETATYDRSVELVNGTPTVVWVQREKTQTEQELSAPDLTEVLTAKLVAQENSSPQPWKQPEGAHDAYLPGAIVTDGPGGAEYRNDLPIPNVWGLLVHGWVPVNPTPVTEVQEWTQPPAESPHMIGDRVWFGDPSSVYESLIDNNIWSPAGYPAGWQLVA